MLAAHKKKFCHKTEKNETLHVGYKHNENNPLNIQYIVSPTASRHMYIISNEDPDKQTL